MCVCCCTCVAYVCAYVREKVMFEEYGGECESISDQWKFFLFLSESMSDQWKFFLLLAIY